MMNPKTNHDLGTRRLGPRPAGAGSRTHQLRLRLMRGSSLASDQRRRSLFCEGAERAPATPALRVLEDAPAAAEQVPTRERMTAGLAPAPGCAGGVDPGEPVERRVSER